MQVRVFKDLNNFDEFEFEVSSIKEVLSGLKLHKGQEYTNNIIENNYKYILIPFNEEDKPVVLIPDVILSDLSDFNTLLIIPEIEGEVPAVAVAAVLGVSATSATALIVTAVVNIALSMALNMVMSLLSPTKEFSSDPSSAQKNNSNLFNGAPLIREQGGSVPLAFGEGFAGGVLISSSLTTVES
jgi:predicted phage tail protein